jgi:hypothetical protein
MSLDDIALAVKAATNAIEPLNRIAFSALRLYRSGGGEGQSWRTAGAYLRIPKDNRLVLEALFLKRGDTCVVRVYEESPIQFFFARKFDIRGNSCEEIMALAVDALVQRLPARIPTPRQVPASLGLDVEQALLPIPPPVNLSQIPG